MIHAVIDTNVLVSGLIASLGNEALIVLAIQQGLIKPYFSAEILEEYTEVLARPKFGFPPDEIEAVISLMRSRGEQVLQPEPLASPFLTRPTRNLSPAPSPPLPISSSPATSGIFPWNCVGASVSSTLASSSNALPLRCEKRSAASIRRSLSK